MKILLIEDEVELGRLGAQQLQQLGHSVTTVVSLEEAKRVYGDDNNAFDLVLTDHRLPDGRGVDYILNLKKERPELKYAVVSGCLTLADRQMLKAANVPFFLKPILYSAVLKELRKPPPSIRSKATPPSPDPDDIPLTAPVGDDIGAVISDDFNVIGNARARTGEDDDTLSEPEFSPDMISKALVLNKNGVTEPSENKSEAEEKEAGAFARLLERFKRKNRQG